MDVELLKTIGAIIGPLLGAIALVLQRVNERKQAQTAREVQLSDTSRAWAEDFREEMNKMREQVELAQRNALDCQRQQIEMGHMVEDLNRSVSQLTAEKNALREEVLELQGKNKRLEEMVTVLTSDNSRLREEVITLQRENATLRATVEAQAKQIKELQRGVST